MIKSVDITVKPKRLIVDKADLSKFVDGVC